VTDDKGSELRMPADEFDRMMRGAIQATPPTPSKPRTGSGPKGGPLQRGRLKDKWPADRQKTRKNQGHDDVVVAPGPKSPAKPPRKR
jgi:hypothetical protein